MYLFKRKNLLNLILIISFIFLIPCNANAQIQVKSAEDGSELRRSLESVRDLDYDTWQLVAYKQNQGQDKIILRIVGFPGRLRIDHPTSLIVHSGRKDWELKDITMSNKALANDSREAASEFDLSPLIAELTNNRPLRLMLKDVFTELPIPPYLVSEWRSLITSSKINE